jgi:uncharacterized phage protein gp47/JayE
MPNQVTSTGIETATQSELSSTISAALETIYGADIDLDPDSPDGQEINIFIQAVLDVEDLITAVYNGFDPDNAIGAVLDQRVAINGIQRQAGTYTTVNVTIGTSQSVNLQGLDDFPDDPFTVADAQGNQYELQVTQDGFNPGGGGTPLAFQAATPGALNPTPNTITVPVTIVLGVTIIGNTGVATTLGINEETDAALKVRRQQSVSLASQGYLAGLRAALLNLTGMVAAFVYENVTGAVNSDSVPGHSIWVIVSGTASAADIAQAIYTKRNAGCGMFGATTYVITQVDNSLFTVAWDGVVQEALFMKFNVLSINGIGVPNIAAIGAGLALSFVPGVFAEVNVNELATLVQDIDPNSLVTNAGFDITSGGAFSNNILLPASKNKQFQVTAPNIIILPMILVAAGGQLVVNSGIVISSATIVHGGNTLQFSQLGGFGTMVYSVFSGAGSINSSTGLYTSGTVGTDVVKVTDGLGNSAICTVTVT